MNYNKLNKKYSPRQRLKKISRNLWPFCGILVILREEAMKRLYVIRHAKSRKDIPGISDRHRPLSKKGLKDAQDIGKRLKKSGVSMDAFYSSPAKRALDTAKLIARGIGSPTNLIRIVSSLYDSSIPELMKMIKRMDDTASSAAIFGHNPEFFELINYLTPRTIEKFPTCGVYGIDFKITSWRNVSRKKGTIAFSQRPKK